MGTALWIVAGALAIVFLMAATMKLAWGRLGSEAF